MPEGLFVGLLVVFSIIVIAVWYAIADQKKLQAMSPEDRKRELRRRREKLHHMKEEERVRKEKETWGTRNSMLVCPHCQEKGSVRVKPITKKTGISGAKATGAVMTGGLSVLATGLSQKENKTQAHCDKCKSTWVF